jgi:hypothetical protein
MEDPAEWDRLTAAMETAPPEAPGWTWAFLVLQGYVEDGPRAETEFRRMWQEERAREPVAGPSLGWRLAGALRAAGIALPSAAEPDPYGRLARSRAAAAWQWHRP